MELIKTDGSKLKKDELLQFNLFLLELSKLNYLRKISLIFRGEKLSNLFDKLNIDNDFKCPNFSQLLYRLFMVGEKGRYFFNELINRGNDLAIPFDDISEDTFVTIFNHLKRTIKSKEVRALKFYENNFNFVNYFLDKKNKAAFISSINRCNTIEKNYFKRYYLTLLHQLNVVNYKAISHSVSTSTQHLVADTFSGNDPKEDGVIIHAWSPKPMYQSVSKRLKLPLYTGVPYPNEKEITLIGGILPHYIIGLEVKKAAKFFINSAIFRNNADINTFKEGLDLDQSTFPDVLAKTNYKRGFKMVGDAISEI